MNKFKKGLIMALAVGVLMMGSVFGASGDTATFTINTEVVGVAQIGVFTSLPTTNASFAAPIINVTKDFGIIGNNTQIGGLTDTTYLAVRYNGRGTFSVGVTATELTDGVESPSAYNIGYSLTFSGGDLGTTGIDHVINSIGTSTSDLTALVKPATYFNGLKIYSFPFTTVIPYAEYENAPVGNYEAIITFTLTAN